MSEFELGWPCECQNGFYIVSEFELGWPCEHENAWEHFVMNENNTIKMSGL